MMRTHEAGTLRKSDAGQTVTLAGWVGRRRDHGGVAFLDVRDRSGSVQVVLHDAWRKHYRCAFASYRSGRRFGDEWWIGAHRDTDFADVLPWHAFERHQEPAG